MRLKRIDCERSQCRTLNGECHLWTLLQRPHESSLLPTFLALNRPRPDKISPDRRGEVNLHLQVHLAPVLPRGLCPR